MIRRGVLLLVAAVLFLPAAIEILIRNVLGVAAWLVFGARGMRVFVSHYYGAEPMDTILALRAIRAVYRWSSSTANDRWKDPRRSEMADIAQALAVAMVEPGLAANLRIPRIWQLPEKGRTLLSLITADKKRRLFVTIQEEVAND